MVAYGFRDTRQPQILEIDKQIRTHRENIEMKQLSGLIKEKERLETEDAKLKGKFYTQYKEQAQSQQKDVSSLPFREYYLPRIKNVLMTFYDQQLPGDPDYQKYKIQIEDSPQDLDQIDVENVLNNIMGNKNQSEKRSDYERDLDNIVKKIHITEK
jgi:hypothetical protein